MKKALAMFLAIMMIASMAVMAEAAPAEKGTITLAFWEQDIPDWWDFVYENTGIRVEYELIDTADYASTMMNRVTSGNGPDIFFPREKGLNKTYMDGGYIVNIGEEFGVDFCKEYLSDAALANNYTVFGDGNIYGVPDQIYYHNILFYNKDYFAEHDLAIPTNIEELLDVCQKIKDNGDIAFIEGGSEWGGHSNHFSFSPEPILNMNEGPEYMAGLSTGDSKMTDDQVKKAIGYYLKSREYVAEDSPYLTHVEAWERFAAGESVMFGGMSWMFNQNYEILEPDFDCGVMPAPYNYPGNEYKIGANATSAFALVNTNGKNKELALEYEKFFMTHLNDYLEIAGRVTPVISDGRTLEFSYGDMLAEVSGYAPAYVPESWPASFKQDYFSFMEGMVVGTKTVDDLPELQAKLEADLAG